MDSSRPPPRRPLPDSPRCVTVPGGARLDGRFMPRGRKGVIFDAFSSAEQISSATIHGSADGQDGGGLLEGADDGGGLYPVERAERSDPGGQEVVELLLVMADGAGQEVERASDGRRVRYFGELTERLPGGGQLRWRHRQPQPGLRVIPERGHVEFQVVIQRS